jgi:hypothetical protein
MSAPAQLRIRGAVPRSQKTDTDLYVTKDSSAASVFAAVERALRTFDHVTLHATGAANYRALKLAVALNKAHPGLLTQTVSTRTIETTDFYLPVTADAQREARPRLLNGVDIRIDRV